MGKVLFFRRYHPPRREGPRHWPFLLVLLLLALSVAIGAFAHQRPDREAKFVGVVQTLPASGLLGDWTVAGVVVHVSEQTAIDQTRGPVQLGTLVKVEGSFRDDRSVDAREVEVLANPGPHQPPAASKVFGVLKLTPTPAAPEGAEGVALVREFAVGGQPLRQDLKVAVEHLWPRQSYDVVVDGVHAGGIVTDDRGEGQLFLSTAPIPGAEPLPQALQPVSARQQVEVLAGSTVVLAGNFADARWDGSPFPSREYLAVAPLLSPAGVVIGLGVAEIEQAEQRLKVAAFALPANAPITVVADGLTLGTVTSNAAGAIHVVFSTAPEDDQLPLPEEALPVSSWLHLELQDAQGQTLAAGDFATVPRPGTVTAPGQVRRHLGKPHR